MAKEKKVKVDFVGARVDPDFKELVEDYIDDADITMGVLIRKALTEYMERHPVTKKEG